MKSVLLAFIFSFFTFVGFAQNQSSTSTKPDPTKNTAFFDASCGKCKFGLESNSCELAIRKDGKIYLVQGTSINDHGDAHAKNGFCNAIRMAAVQGEILDNKFIVSYFKLLNTKEVNKLKRKKNESNHFIE